MTPTEHLQTAAALVNRAFQELPASQRTIFTDLLNPHLQAVANALAVQEPQQPAPPAKEG